MKNLSDLDKHLKKFDEISIEPEATDDDLLFTFVQLGQDRADLRLAL